MAAGQARLLSITARLSDNEHTAQSLSYTKQRLADQTDQVNAAYNAALEATKLTVLTSFNGSGASYEDISYNLMTGYNTVSCGKQYVVTDNQGKILVSDAIAKAFETGRTGSGVSRTNGTTSVDFNKFLSAFGYSQVDVDFSGISSNNTLKAEKEELVHQAWDKYFVSIGQSSEIHTGNGQLSVYNPKVEFSYANGYPTKRSIQNLPNTISVKVADGQAYNATLNKDANGNLTNYNTYKYNTIKIQDQVAYYADYAAWVKDNTLPEPDMLDAKYTISTEACNGEIITPSYTGADGFQYTFKPWCGNGVLYLEQTSEGLKYPIDTFRRNVSIGGTSYISTDKEFQPGDTNVITSLDNPAAVYIEEPINFDGTTQEQRELYDYAVALTRAFQNNGVGSNVTTPYQDPEVTNKIAYYRNIYNQMLTCGYYTESNEADTIKDSKWFEEQLKKGNLMLKYYSAVDKNFVQTSITEDDAIQEVKDDRQLGMIEAKYTQDIAAIEKKDQKIDLELKKLDSEHSALQTEYDSVKSVIDKNVEKTFNIFS